MPQLEPTGSSKHEPTECEAPQKTQRTKRFLPPSDGNETIKDKIDRLLYCNDFTVGRLQNMVSNKRSYKQLFKDLDSTIEILTYSVNDCYEFVMAYDEHSTPSRSTATILPPYGAIYTTLKYFVLFLDILRRGMEARDTIYVKKGKKLKEAKLPSVKIPAEYREKLIREALAGADENFPSCITKDTKTSENQKQAPKPQDKPTVEGPSPEQIQSRIAERIQQLEHTVEAGKVPNKSVAPYLVLYSGSKNPCCEKCKRMKILAPGYQPH